MYVRKLQCTSVSVTFAEKNTCKQGRNFPRVTTNLTPRVTNIIHVFPARIVVHFPSTFLTSCINI